MRRLPAFALAALIAAPSLSRGEEALGIVAPAPYELRGPQLPTVTEESREVVRLASAVDQPTLAPEPPHPVIAAGTSPERRQDLELLNRKTVEFERLRAEIDSLREKTETASMVAVSVQVLEVSLTRMRKLGFEANPDFGVIPAGGSISGSAIPAEYTQRGYVSPAAFQGAAFDGLTRTLIEKNLAKVLSSPSIMVIPGQPASFFVGSQVPLPSAPGSDAPVEFVKAGIGLDVKADCLGGGRVRLEVRPSISSMGESRDIGGGANAPTRKLWQLDTACEMAFGETLLIPGLVEDRIESQHHNDGRVVEVVNQIGTWVVIHADDASKIASKQQTISVPEALPTTTPAAYSPPVAR
jgi:hypothetical protein